MDAQPDYFALYGLQPTLSPDASAVRKRFYELSRQYHPDRAGAAGQQEALQKTAQINEGYRLLSDPDALLGYALKHHGIVADNEAYKLPHDFLMDMMELNEAVGNAAMDPSMRPDALREAEAAFAAWEADARPLVARYNDGDRSPELLAALKDAYYRRKYLQRLREQIENA